MAKSKNHKPIRARGLTWKNERCQRCGKLIEYYGYAVDWLYSSWKFTKPSKEIFCRDCGSISIDVTSQGWRFTGSPSRRSRRKGPLPWWTKDTIHHNHSYRPVKNKNGVRIG